MRPDDNGAVQADPGKTRALPFMLSGAASLCECSIPAFPIRIERNHETSDLNESLVEHVTSLSLLPLELSPFVHEDQCPIPLFWLPMTPA